MSHPQRAEGRHRAARHHPALKDGRPTDINLCAIVNACSPNIAPPARLLPANFLPMSSVRSYFDTWNRNGIFIKINNTLRQLVRKALDRDLAALAVMAPHVRRSCSPVSSAMQLSRPGSLTCLYCTSQRRLARFHAPPARRSASCIPSSFVATRTPASVPAIGFGARSTVSTIRSRITPHLAAYRRRSGDQALCAGLLAMIRMAWRNVHSGRGR